MLNTRYSSNIETICPICSFEKTSTINSHLYSNLRCLKCQHESIISKEQNIVKFVNKVLKRSQLKQEFNVVLENVIEYSFCPYWTLMKFFDKTSSVCIRKKQKDIIQYHTFSNESVRIFADNIQIPSSIIETKDFYLIKFQQ